MIIPAGATLVRERSAVGLPRYAHRIEYLQECPFFGVLHPDNRRFLCHNLWSKSQRDMVLFYLAEAQEEIENELRYFLDPKWVVGTFAEEPDGNQRLIDSQDFRIPLQTRWAMVLAGGVRAESDIAIGAAVSHAADPAVVGPIATTVTEPDEIKVYHPGMDVEIHPSRMVISGGAVTIYIPRCRMVRADLADNSTTEGIAYETTANFEQTVDVKRVYNDPSSHAVLVAPHHCSDGCSANGCGEYTQTACIYVDDQRLGLISLRPATYASGTWTPSGYNCVCPSLVRLHYYSGLPGLWPTQLEDAVIRLAHSKMPEEPCGCDVAKRLWLRDREIPQVLTRERLNNPFGLSNGAWVAWQFTQDNKIQKMSVL